MQGEIFQPRGLFTISNFKRPMKCSRKPISAKAEKCFELTTRSPERSESLARHCSSRGLITWQRSATHSAIYTPCPALHTTRCAIKIKFPPSSTSMNSTYVKVNTLFITQNLFSSLHPTEYQARPGIMPLKRSTSVFSIINGESFSWYQKCSHLWR